MLPQAQDLVQQLDEGDGVLVLTDIYGATPGNIALRLLAPGKVEGVAGVNLPMLIRALTYREHGLAAAVEKALSGGTEGVIHMTTDACGKDRGGRDAAR
jgi:PTS system ascorbate-specific IIA component